ncbi:YSIRK-targeted triacylglycerol lipase [Staphylococcus carnosus]|uniref:triacylglycerol lipase n=1 Tax=Staphylococcus carnosus (strain TM300) TaxID=396513 RepID=B9DIH4_STACT|nr:YSIRK-type signal peptide-containing protein [Staphylococcus carnosus]KOR12611.1 hypothetical protein AMC75_09070 [Staphylococcus carnosus]UTB77124.1 hypothetical protein A2I62_00395 [Staphylococcus carnosus]UTB86672.1 hypothetical protein A2I63_00390 [Staphylococcus carnosus]UTB89020.1 hypothetical protein A2I64_00395 [Staphylococcus carnosus]CAL29299.1 triacylglycerol lipase precursor [Staphylococcus carnosus subsp. carnosus TM300]
MEKRENKYSIRKFAIGTSSILVASLFFIGSGGADAAEASPEKQSDAAQVQESVDTTQLPDKQSESQQQATQNQTETLLSSESVEQPEQPEIERPSEQPNLHKDTVNPDKSSEEANTNQPAPSAQPQPVSSQKEQSESTNKNEVSQTDQHQTQTDIQNDINNQTSSTSDNTSEQPKETSETEKTPAALKQTPEKEDAKAQSNAATEQASQTTSNKDSQYPIEKITEDTLKHVQNENKANKTNDVSKQAFPNKKTEPPVSKNETAHNPKKVGTDAQTDLSGVVHNVKQNVEQVFPKNENHSNEQSEQPDYNTETAIKQPTQSITEQAQPPEPQSAPKSTSSNQDNNFVLKQTSNQNEPNTKQPEDNKKNDNQKGIEVLKSNAAATTNNKNTVANAKPVTDQTNKQAAQKQYKNQDPIILVHGFNGLVGETAGPTSGNYWGGDRTDLQKDLENNGYNVYEASIGAYGSNYDRAVELYYYIKGGTVDYGAAHAEKYGHERYGKTYEGVYPEWQPGQKVHLVGHSMGGQTIRQLEEFLRNGNQEEIDYQKAHGGTISPLFQGNHDNMISSITTVASPHNGTHAADVGNEAFIRQVLYDNMKLQGNKYSQVDYGLAQWGFKQGKNESYPDYVERIKKQSKLWTTTDNAIYDLSRKGANELNERTSLNPNIVYKSYTGESTRPGLNGRQRSDIHMAASKRLTGNVIGKADEKEWRENDGLVSTISAQHPFGQNATPATDEVQKGVWQVSPIQHDWDHGDFVGTDATEAQIKTEDLRQFWLGIAEDAVKSEAVTD